MAQNDDQQKSVHRSYRRPSVLCAAFVVGLLLFLATRNPVAGAVIPAVMSGWGAFSSGAWVLRTDPDRKRAWVCFAFQLAAGCWQAAAAALISVIAFIVVSDLNGLVPNGQSFATTMLALVGGVLLNTIIGTIAVVAAWRNRLRVWAHPKLRQTLAEESRLPDDGLLNQFRFNYAIFVIVTALSLPVLVLGSVAVVVSFTLDTPANQGGMIPVIVMLVAFLAVPLMMIPCYAWLSSRMIARSPRECWPYSSE